MKTIGAAKFKEHCLGLIDDLDKEGLIITKNGKPVAKIIPLSEDRNNQIGKFKEDIQILGSTLSTGIKWNAES